MKLSVLKIIKQIDEQIITLFPVLIQNESHKYLIDCGYEETFCELSYELELLGVGINDLTGVIITHDDHDHLCGLSNLKKLNKNLKIFCGEHEHRSVSGHTKSERLIQAENLLNIMPEEHKSNALEFIKKLKSIKRFNIDGTFTDNEIFEKELIIVHTPGHTKGHISIYHTEDRTLIAGDAIVIENDEFNIANPNFTLDLETAIKSVEKIKKLNPERIICYHGGVAESGIDEKLTKLIHKYKR